MKAAIFVAVVEVGAHAIADDYAKALVKGQISGVEHAMNVASKQEAIFNFVIAATAVRLDVCGIQRWQDSPARDCALTAVCVCNGQAKRALATQ